MRELERETIPPSPTPAPSDGNGALDALRLAIVGTGRAGSSLARAAAGAGITAELAGRADLQAVAARSDAALLCVPDAAIEEVASRVATAIPPVRVVGHVSGAAGLATLNAACKRGAHTFVLHPLQTLPDGSAELAGAGCAVSGSSPEAIRFATALAERLGMRPFELADEQRAAYHAAACIASNFFVALEESAVELLAAAGVAEPRDLLAPLVLRTAANWSELGPASLTGPIARGDEATVDRHLDALAASAPELLPLYGALAERTRALAGAQRAHGDRE